MKPLDTLSRNMHKFGGWGQKSASPSGPGAFCQELGSRRRQFFMPALHSCPLLLVITSYFPLGTIYSRSASMACPFSLSTQSRSTSATSYGAQLPEGSLWPQEHAWSLAHHEALINPSYHYYYDYFHGPLWVRSCSLLLGLWQQPSEFIWAPVFPLLHMPTVLESHCPSLAGPALLPSNFFLIHSHVFPRTGCPHISRSCSSARLDCHSYLPVKILPSLQITR